MKIILLKTSLALTLTSSYTGISSAFLTSPSSSTSVVWSNQPLKSFLPKTSKPALNSILFSAARNHNQLKLHSDKHVNDVNKKYQAVNNNKEISKKESNKNDQEDENDWFLYNKLNPSNTIAASATKGTKFKQKNATNIRHKKEA